LPNARPQPSYGWTLKLEHLKMSYLEIWRKSTVR
jgi:hypothetical protein